MNILAVDPGDSHVGTAVSDPGGITAVEFSAKDWLQVFMETVSEYDLVVIEEFKLYPGSAPALSWSQLDTVKMIGAMEWIARCSGVPIVLQSAAVKIPTRAQANARGIEWKNKSGHASDALLHLYYYMLRHGMEV
jgi:hypothetical protein